MKKQIALSSQIRKANVIARKEGFNRATKIVVGSENKIIDYCQYGYRKNTTDEYVSSSYRANFGWKNTYYQNAECSIMITADQKNGTVLEIN